MTLRESAHNVSTMPKPGQVDANAVSQGTLNKPGTCLSTVESTMEGTTGSTA